jgi:transposase
MDGYHGLTDLLRQESHILRIYLEEWGLRDHQRNRKLARAAGENAVASMDGLIDALTRARNRVAAELRELP